ncbi:GSCOCG00010989001-RA-CDS [Cotesia congregata]|nr:GSCOCG00010989001-RA-CDS [Cotesia congregata]
MNDHYKNDNCNDINSNLKILSTESHTKVKNLIDFTDLKINEKKKEVRFLNVNENNKDQVNMTGLNDEQNLEPTCNVSPDSETLNKSIIKATEARKPLVRSVVEGNFLPINNGFITKSTEPLNWETIDEIPIIIMNGPLELENEESIALYPSFEYQSLPSSATLGENNDCFASDNKDSEINGFQDKTVSSITKRDDETLTSNNSVKNFSFKYDQCPNQSDEDPNDPNYEVGDSEDLDYDSEYSDSHISELEELDDLDDFEEPEDLRKDSIVRDDFNTSADWNFDLSSMQLQESRVNDLDIDLNAKQNEVLDDEQVSEPLLFDNSRSSMSTLDQSKNDSTFVPDSESYLNESNLSNSLSEEIANIDSVNNGNNSVDELMSKAVAPNLNELEVTETGKETKKTFCCFCLQLKAVPSRHYRDVHSNEKEVKQFLAMKNNSVERKAAIEKLRLRGNNIYNLNRDFNKGKLLVCRQPRQNSVANAGDYKPCSKCGKWLLNVKRHQCPYERDHCDDRSHLVKSKIMMGQIHENANELTRKILAILNDDEISEAVRYDPLLIVFANDLTERYTNQHQHKMIRSRLRMLGGILLKVMEYNEAVFEGGMINQKPNPVNVNKFADIIDPRLYDNMIVAIQNINGMNIEKSECRAPSSATAAGTWITKVAKVYQKELIKSLEFDKAKHVEYFLKVHEVEFSTRINNLARSVQIQQRRHNQKPLPTMDDINLFRDYVEKNLALAIESLVKGYTDHAWKKLAQCTLIFILLFNRKRPGELQRILIDDYKRAETFEKTNKDEYDRLSSMDKKLVDEYLRIEFGGKKGREVPLLLSSNMRGFIDLILTHRSAAKIHPDNPFIFALPGFDGTRYKHLKACALMRNYSKRCGAQYPKRIRATGLRKHFATTVASLKIDECQIYDVSNFMGHAEKIHRDHYRQAVVTRDVCGVSRILEVASGVKRVMRRDQDRSASSSTSQKQSDASDDDSSAMDVSLDMDQSTEESNSNSDQDNSTVTAHMKKFLTKKRKLDDIASSDEEFDDVTSRSDKNPKISKTKPYDDALTAEPRRINTKRTWSSEEKTIVLKTFGYSIKLMKTPSAEVMTKFLEDNPIVKRSVPQLRSWINNQYKDKLEKKKMGH